MIVMMVVNLLLSGAFVSPSADAQGAKYGILARRFVSFDQAAKMLYTAGVMDGLDLAGVRCPRPPSYGELIAKTEALIYRNISAAESVWAATAIVAALAEMGCRIQ
jgi:hypothetical protein